MKTTQLMLLGGAMVAFLACENENSAERLYDERMDELEDFVDSVETAVNRDANHDWSRLDSRFTRLTNEVKNLEPKVSDPDTEDRRKIAERYGEAKQKSVNQSQNNIETEAEAHLNNLESWWDEHKVRAEGTIEQRASNVGDDIEEAAEESMAWLEENFERLGDNIKERYQKVKADIED
ncbi:MAG: hypothetical protein JJU34_09050 [Lunatimonas sp.]|uniref:hypothetical protein n=1 Tax=Lunatimonas sp. TaxID=2060141 RepID=UPI00263B3CFF|nr:hypothetical protein [Lunatimonas sp.]MCC5937416.1 hypothetical protein [Lunatimonas sp.]